VRWPNFVIVKNQRWGFKNVVLLGDAALHTVDEHQEAAHSSLIWFEQADEKMSLYPIPFAFELRTRSHRVKYDNLKSTIPNLSPAMMPGVYMPERDS
jgi:hypothetical protein